MINGIGEIFYAAVDVSFIIATLAVALLELPVITKILNKINRRDKDDMRYAPIAMVMTAIISVLIIVIVLPIIPGGSLLMGTAGKVPPLNIPDGVFTDGVFTNTGDMLFLFMVVFPMVLLFGIYMIFLLKPENDGSDNTKIDKKQFTWDRTNVSIVFVMIMIMCVVSILILL